MMLESEKSREENSLALTFFPGEWRKNRIGKWSEILLTRIRFSQLILVGKIIEWSIRVAELTVHRVGLVIV